MRILKNKKYIKDLLHKIFLIRLLGRIDTNPEAQFEYFSANYHRKKIGENKLKSVLLDSTNHEIDMLHTFCDCFCGSRIFVHGPSDFFTEKLNLKI